MVFVCGGLVSLFEKTKRHFAGEKNSMIMICGGARRVAVLCCPFPLPLSASSTRVMRSRASQTTLLITTTS